MRTYWLAIYSNNFIANYCLSILHLVSLPRQAIRRTYLYRSWQSSFMILRTCHTLTSCLPNIIALSTTRAALAIGPDSYLSFSTILTTKSTFFAYNISFSLISSHNLGLFLNIETILLARAGLMLYLSAT